MHSDNSKISDVFKDLSFSEAEIEIIESVMFKIDLKKGIKIIKAGDTVKDMYFVLQGCLRAFHIDIHGKEHTVQFAIKGWWITDFTAFFTESKAIMDLEVLRDATIYRLSKDDREYMFSQIPATETFIRKKLENAYAAFQKRILRNLSQSASQRYVNFVKDFPNIEKNIKNYHIASYLGITTESLSRIRKEITRH
ncbi:Crp/Fnr family transcriptional regulator [Psychroserpens burtonensis]|uniref:Crp/Fnr family transcriptional regulator n=1 Tax=Psychroserpens burtonensis TaxID=49278 RepID=A0A5C7B3Q3_9FLAO|nr:Crp/Fnr family transcriptional regulator [Psychroserpens burtonensis]TXE15949.1 Crp/Fnr family transcriptional regulator [Psychroserpens burtonensis]